jgi:hypothetical protein
MHFIVIEISGDTNGQTWGVTLWKEYIEVINCPARPKDCVIGLVIVK